MKKYASIRVSPEIARKNSPVGRGLAIISYQPTVEKTPDGLWWRSHNLYIPVKYITEVIKGDISEYLL